MFAALRPIFARNDFSVSLLWVLVILAVVALLIFIFRR